jgi:hypothetical protein
MLGWIIRLGRMLVVLTLFIALEGHLIVLQAVAWGGMLLTYSQSATIEEGIAKTFDGRHPCSLCKSIQKSRQKKPAPQVLVKKLALLCALSDAFICAARGFWKLPLFDLFSEPCFPRPLLQPPRLLAV